MENVKKTKNGRFNVFMLVIGICLGLYALSMFLLLFWGLITSVKDGMVIDYNGIGFPKKGEFTLKNYTDLLTAYYETADGSGAYDITGLFTNGLLYALGSAVIQAFVQFVVAYVASRFKYKFCGVFYWIVIFTMVFPTVGTTASGIAVAKALNLYDSIWGQWLMKANFLGMYFLIFYAQLSAFPKDYAEAAYMDGAGNFRIMMGITFPLVRSTFLTIALLLFVNFWNDYTSPMLYMPNVPTISLEAYYIAVESRGPKGASDKAHALAFCFIMLIPMLILFAFLHKRLMGNLSMGGLKE